MAFVPRLCLILGLALCGCRFPSDPGGTLDRVEEGALRVGLLTPRDGFEATPEGRQLAAVAAALGAEVKFREGGAHDLVEELRAGGIDLLAGGLPEDTPFSAEVGLSKPWGEVPVGEESVPAVFGLRQGENAFLLSINRALAR